MFRLQLEAVGALIIGLQETRATQTETYESSTHLRFLAKGDEKGNLGVELWFAKTIPFGWQDDRPCFFQADDFRVLSWSPRHLAVRLVRGPLHVLVVTCHAPTVTDPSRHEWWQSFAKQVLGIAKGDQVVLLGDFNTRLTEPWQPRVGDLCWEQGPEPPDPLLDLLAKLDMWVPATFSSCHVGLSHTWVSPGHGSTSRIDYICVPNEWQCASESSQVLYQVDFGQAGVDHYAVQLTASFSLRAATLPSRRRPKMDVAKMRDPAALATVQEICQSVPLVPWEVDPHTHYGIISDHLVQQLSRAFPVGQAHKRRVFFSEATWAFRQQRVWLRKQIHLNAHTCGTFALRRAFEAWHCCRSSLESGLYVFARVLRCLFELQVHVLELRKLKPALRKSIQQDRKTYLSAVAREAAASPVKSIVDKLRPLLGPPKRRARGPRPIPAIKLEDGSYARDAKEAEDRWIRHFSSIEAGEPQEAETIAANCFRRQGQRDLSELMLFRDDLPTRTEIEAGLRASPSGRAAGKDSVPADVLHIASAQLSLPLYQIFMKVALRLQEPLQWKGGELHHVWKRKQSADSCSSHRAILVSSSVGKAIHGAFRRRCSTLLDRASMPLQIGGRRGFPVQMAMHAARLFQASSLRAGKSCALVFVDLCEAFHRVARPLVHGGTLCPEQIEGVVTALGLDSSVVPRLQSYVTDRPLLLKAGATEWTAQVLAEFSSDSWFAHGSHEGTAIVRSGTRPGDNLADMIFSFLFAEILSTLRASFAEKGLSVVLPWNDQWLRAPPHLAQAQRPDSTVKPLDVTWMDDLALLVEADRPSDLVDKVVAVASATVTECIQATLLPNLAAGKTETVLSLQGPGSRKLKSEIFRGTDPTVQLASDVWPAARLRMVSHYKHVGGLIESRGGSAKEAKCRIGAAWTAFRQRKRQIFMSPVVTHAEKSTLFSSLVESTLYFGVSTWTEVTPAVIAQFQGVLAAMARLMLRPTFSLEAARHVSSAYALAVARILPASDSFRVERLRHFGVLVSQANPEIWALLHHERLWLLQLLDDLEWLSERLAQAGQSPIEVPNWDAAVQLITARPRRWKRLITIARGVALRVALWEAERQQYYGLLLRQLRASGASLPATMLPVDGREFCAVCGKVFRDLRAWSHHAFKVHGRVREERTLVNGRQCPVCLKHFANTEKLCNHVRYSNSCKGALLRSGLTATPTPGIGSRRFDDGSRSLLPAVQAEGPRQFWNGAPCPLEAERPSEEVLLRLEDVFAHAEQFCHSLEVLLQAYQTAFSSVCLQQSRLRATATEWASRLQEQFAEDEDQGLQWFSWHSTLASRLLEVDWLAWLVPDPRAQSPNVATFQDAEVALPWLQFDHLSIARTPIPIQTGFCLALERVDVCASWTFQDFWEGLCPRDFTQWCLENTPTQLVVLSCKGLLSSLAVPAAIKSFTVLEGDLRRLRLYSDLLRGALHLWQHRCPTVVILPDTLCVGSAALRQAAPYSSTVAGTSVIGNCPCEHVPTLFHL